MHLSVIQRDLVSFATKWLKIDRSNPNRQSYFPPRSWVRPYSEVGRDTERERERSRVRDLETDIETMLERDNVRDPQLAFLWGREGPIIADPVFILLLRYVGLSSAFALGGVLVLIRGRGIGPRLDEFGVTPVKVKSILPSVFNLSLPIKLHCNDT